MTAMESPPPVEIVITLAPRPIAGAQVRGVRSATAAVDALLSRDVLDALGLDLLCIEGIEPCEPLELMEATTSGGAGTTAERTVAREELT
jgi:hypothetical protein